MKTLPDLKHKPYGGAWSVHDTVTVNFVKESINAFPKVDVENFLSKYKKWAINGHTIGGINDYADLNYSNGTTETFDKFYQLHTNRRLRLWRGEYFYHQIQAREVYKNNFAWIDQGQVEANDVVVVSAPFSDTGTVPEAFTSIMDQCEKLDVPVMIDMAYLNLSKNFSINLDYKCIQTITTSLSKVFPVETFRIGIRMNRTSIDDTLNAYVKQNTPYVNTTSVCLGDRLIEEFDNQWLYQKYQEHQQDMCNELDVKPSPCVIFGIDERNQYPEYNRGADTNRLCYSRYWDARTGK
jgi:hypothetical protein